MIGPRIGTRIGAHIGAAVGVANDPIASTGSIINGHVFFVGDSNTVGQGSTDHMDNGLGIQSAYTGATERHYYSQGVITDPVTWIDTGRVNLAPYDATPGNPAVGPQLSFGRYGRQYGGWSSTMAISTMAVYGSSLLHWRPTSVSPANPKNLRGQLIDFITSEIATSGKPISVIVWALGTNDAGDNTLTANFATRLAAIEADLRARFGSSWLFAIVRVNTNMTAQPAGNITTIQAAADAFATAHPTNCISINVDRIPVSNSHIHYVADENISLGNLIAEAVCEKLLPGRSTDLSSGAAPWPQSYNEPTVRASASTGDLTVRGPARSKPRDWEYLVVGQNPNAVAPALTTAAGFTAVSGAQGVSVAAGVNQYLYLYERRVTVDGHQTDPVITDNNTSKQARIFSVRNAYQPGNLTTAIEALTLTPNNAQSTSVSVPGTTTLGHDRLVVHVQTGYCSSANAGSSWADATLAGFSLLVDSTDDTNETTAIAAGTLATAGATGTITGTRAATTIMEDVVLSIAPPVGASETELTLTLTDATDPVTGGQNEVYTAQVTNVGTNTAASLSVAIVLDASLTYVSASGTGWSINRSGQTVTCTLASLAAGSANPITVTATTALAGATITTSASVTSSSASTVNASQSTLVQITATKDATSNIFTPVSTTEWSNLSLHGSPSFQWGCQDASGSLAADFGGLALPTGGAGQAYQQTVSGWSRKSVTTPDNSSSDWVSSSASLPDISATSVAVQAYWRPPAVNPAASRRIFAFGTTTSISAQINSTGKLVWIVGTNNTTGTVTFTGAGVVILRIMLDRTNSRAILYATDITGTKNEKLSVAIPATVPTGKQIVLGGAAVSAEQGFLFVDIFSGAAVEQSDANTKADWQTLGWSPGWT